MPDSSFLWHFRKKIKKVLTLLFDVGIIKKWMVGWTNT